MIKIKQKQMLEAYAATTQATDVANSSVYDYIRF